MVAPAATSDTATSGTATSNTALTGGAARQADLRPITEAAEQILSGGPTSHRKWDEETWWQLEDSGLTLVELPEDAGGGGGSLREAAEVVRVAGARSNRIPLAETALVASWALHAAGLPVPPTGALTAAVNPSRLTAARTGKGWKLQGTARRVAYVRVCERVILVADSDGGPVVLSVDPALATRTEKTRNLAGEPRESLTFERTLITDGAVVEEPVRQEIALRGGLTRIVLAAGAAQTVFDLVLRHVAEREQFGRPLSAFQAVQHLVAELAGEVQALTLGAEAALLSLAMPERADRSAPGGRAVGLSPAGLGHAQMAVGSAKVVSAQASGRIAAIAHQLFGGIGVTHEHPLHRSTTRLWSWREEGGTEGQWSDRLADRALDGSAPGLWQQLVGI